MTTDKKDSRFFRFLKLPMYLWTLVFVFVSLTYVIGLSFMGRGELIGVDGQFTMANYARLKEPQYLKVLLNSLKLAALTTVLCLGIGYPFGYLMARLNPGPRTVVLMLLIVPFWTNSLIRIFGWRILLMGNGPLNTFLQSLGLIERPLKLLNTEGAVFLGMVYALLPLMIMPSSNAVEKLDYSVVEAARDLGAGPLKAFFTITVPLTLPGLMAGCVLVFIPSMGLFFLAHRQPDPEPDQQPGSSHGVGPERADAAGNGSSHRPVPQGGRQLRPAEHVLRRAEHEK